MCGKCQRLHFKNWVHAMKLHYMLFASACLIITLIIVGFIVLFTVDERPSDSAKVNEHLTSLLPTSNHTFRGFTRFPQLSGQT